MSEQKIIHPLIRKLIYTTSIIWFLVIVVVAITEPDLSNGGYLIVAAPLFILFLIAGYAIIWAAINSIIEWLAATSDKVKIKNAVRNNIILIIVILIISQILK